MTRREQPVSRQRGPERNLQVVIANEEYEHEKEQARKAGHPLVVTYKIIERRRKLKAGSLVNYRANHP